MKKRSLLWQLVPFFLAVSVVVIVAVSWFSLRALHRFHVAQTSNDLTARASLLTGQFLEPVLAGDGRRIDDQAKALGRPSGTRITVILPSGEVTGDSDEMPAFMDNHGGRPEVRTALQGMTGVSMRFSPTLRRQMLYAAVPLRSEDRIVGVVRAAIPLLSMEGAFRTLRLEIVLGAMLILVVAGIASMALSRRISLPLEEMKRAAERFAHGDLTGRVPVAESEEIGGLAEALNSLAVQLGEKLALLEKQGNEQAAVFASMVESVIAVDDRERIINMNRAAAALIGVPLEQVKGRGLHEVIRNTDLQGFVARTLASDAPIEGDIVLHNGQDRYLQAHGTTLRDSRGDKIGALVVLNDVTRLRRLENVRKDFVANVSHELRTPITSIKGFVETLSDGAIENRDEARRFLDIVAKHADRLNSIIEDLLSLSRIEQEAERGQVPLEPHAVRAVLHSAVQLCQLKAREKQVGLEVDCPEDLRVNMNAPLLEQAVVNLIDNAVKYSNTAGRVRVEARALNGQVVIGVQDWGVGIESRHHQRLFERFYRVDKARSRQLGGTGLGLAIAKHIVQAHAGRITVESAPGEGSVFRIHLPQVA